MVTLLFFSLISNLWWIYMMYFSTRTWSQDIANGQTSPNYQHTLTICTYTLWLCGRKVTLVPACSANHTWILMHVHKTYTHSPVHTCKHTQTYIYTHTHTYACTCTNKDTHTYPCPLSEEYLAKVQKESSLDIHR